MEIRWRGGWSLVLGWKIQDPSLLLTKPHRDTWIRVKDELKGMWAEDGGQRGQLMLGRPWLGPNGPQLFLVDRWGHINRV